MTVRVAALAAAAVVAAALGAGIATPTAAEAAGPLTFSADLAPGNEVPPVTTSPDATGSATLTLSPTEDKVTVNLTFAGLTGNQTSAHIHRAGAGVNGPIVISLGTAGGTSGSTGPVTAAVDAGMVQDLRDGNWYVNVHTEAFPAGEVRGQLAEVPGTELKCRGEVATIIGTNAAEIITGTAGRDVIAALGGNDVVRARGGNDVVCGGSGSDLLVGGRGHDTLAGGNGNDELFGSRGRDRLLGGKGADELGGGPGNDYGRGGPGNDLMYGIERP